MTAEPVQNRITREEQLTVRTAVEMKPAMIFAGLGRGGATHTLTDLKDYTIVGALLYDADAPGQKPPELRRGVADSLTNADAKRLAARVGSDVELWGRLAEFRTLIARQSKELVDSLRSARDELMRTEGIDFNLHNK